MDLEQQWKNMGTAEDPHGIIEFSLIENKHFKKTASPLYKIKKALEIGMSWIIILLLAYVAGIILFEPLFTKLSLLILAGYSVYCFIQSLKLHKQIDPLIIAGNSLKTELERHYQRITQWCKTQERNAIFLYPVSLFGGAILGMSSEGVEKMNRVMHKPSLWIALIGIIVLMVPVLYYITRQMMKVAYYNHLQHLKQLISALEE